jgi:cell division protein FtsB
VSKDYTRSGAALYRYAECRKQPFIPFRTRWIKLMWLASLLTSSAASFGRILVVGLLPNAVPIVFVWLLLRAHSFAGVSDWSRLIPADLKIDVVSVLIVLLVITLLTVLVQPFQLRMIRLLEGYWDSWWLTAQVAPVFVEYQTRRKKALETRINHLGRQLELLDGSPATTLQEQKRRQWKCARMAAEKQRAKLKLERYPRPTDTPNPPTPLLPTALGNALRTGETSAGERYGLTTLASWPRLYPLLSEKFAAMQASARDSLDAAAHFCISFFVVSVVAVVALADEPKAYWIPALAFALCCLSYVGSIAAAVTFTTYLRVAYDLHRFDLLRAMHYKLPETAADEYDQFMKLSEFFKEESENEIADGLAAAKLGDWPYAHPDESAKPAAFPSVRELLGRLGQR